MRTEHTDERGNKPSLWGRLVSWQTIAIASFVATIVALLIAFLDFQEQRPEVTIETISDTNVLDLRRSLQDLSIEFRGQDVQKQNLNLRIVTINVVNSGEIDILQSHFDQDVDWGIVFKNGEVIEARLVDASSEYLRSRVVPQQLGVNTVAFPKVIFERDSVFAIEVLLLHPKDDVPIISPVGKIAGIDKMTVLARPLARQEVGFFTQVFQGNLLVHLVRVILYSFGAFLTMALALFLLISLSELRDNLRAHTRKKRILTSPTIQQMHGNETSKWLVELYEKNGINRLRKLQDVIGNPEALVFAGSLDDSPEVDDTNESNWVGDEKLWGNNFGPLGMQTMLQDLESMGLLYKGEGYNAEVDPAFRIVVGRLVRELGR